MSVNLEKHKTKILDAWNDVISDKSSTDWALFGYEGQTNDLKVVGTGDGGLDELADDLNSGKIMYAFVRVNDPKTSLTKFVLINWQGEGAPAIRKGVCANHINPVSKLLKGAHLTINARVEDDVEKDRVLQKVSAIGSAYSFKEPKSIENVKREPVGTTYSRVNPAKEINLAERDNFWRKEEEEENRRIELERARKQKELEEKIQEQRKRELAEQETHSIQTDSIEKSIPQAEIMRQQRNQEAKELIGSRVGMAKKIFTQNTTSGQMQTKSAPVKPIRNSIAQRINSLNNAQTEEKVESEIKEPIDDVINKSENILIAELKDEILVQDENESKTHITTVSESKEKEQFEHAEYEENSSYSTIKRSPHSKNFENPSQTEEIQNQNNLEQNETIQSIPVTNTNPVEEQHEEIFDDKLLLQDMMEDTGLRARALYDYQAADESEITFDPGDIITHIDRIDEGWWQGLGPDGAYGLFPANYVELIKD